MCLSNRLADDIVFINKKNYLRKYKNSFSIEKDVLKEVTFILMVVKIVLRVPWDGRFLLSI